MEQYDFSEVDAKLSDRELRFVEEYCADFNLQRAATAAGYSAKLADQYGRNLLKKQTVRDAIGERMDALSMTAEETTKRFTSWGRGSVAYFLKKSDDGWWVIDLDSEQAQANLHLIKELKQTERFTGAIDLDGNPVREIRTEIKMYDAMAATTQMARARKVLGDGNQPRDVNIHITNEYKQMSDADLIQRLEERKAQLNRVRGN